MKQTTAPAVVFERERRRLVSVAYGFLGSLAEAEDIVQDAYLRLEQSDFESLREPEAWLTTVVSRLALDRLRSAQHRRETYPGEWLPEPVYNAPLAEQTEITRSRLSIAVLHLLETLKPEERAVFVLREIFEYGYREISEIIGKSEAACRQMMTRARSRVEHERPQPTDAKVMRPIVERFIHALRAGDEQALLNLLAPDAMFVADGGGRVKATVNPVYGAERIVRFYMGLRRKYPNRFVQNAVDVNAEPGFETIGDGELLSLTAVTTDGERITSLRSVLNPEKLWPLTNKELASKELANKH